MASPAGGDDTEAAMYSVLVALAFWLLLLLWLLSQDDAWAAFGSEGPCVLSPR